MLSHAGLGLCLRTSYPKSPFMLVSFLQDLCGVNPCSSISCRTGDWQLIFQLDICGTLTFPRAAEAENLRALFSLTAPHLNALSQEWLVIHLSNAENQWWQEHYHGWTIADCTSFHHFKSQAQPFTQAVAFLYFYSCLMTSALALWLWSRVMHGCTVDVFIGRPLSSVPHFSRLQWPGW